MFKDLSIGVKIMLGQTLLIALVAAFIYSYYPSEEKKAELQAIESKIYNIRQMFSIGVGIGMGDMDFVAVSEAVDWAFTDSSLVFLSVSDTSNYEIVSRSAIGPLPKPVKDLHAGGRPEAIGDIIFYKAPILYQKLHFGTLVIGYSLKPMNERISHLKLTTLYFCLALFVSGVCLSFIITKRITSNITKLSQTVKAISSGAENVHAEITSNDEIGKLGLAFNSMLYRLEGSRADLVKYSEQLKKQNEELKQFSYVVSHDLKAPLMAIFRLSEWIQEDIGDSISEETKRHMEILRGRVFRLESLINGLLQYSKIGHVNFPVEKLDMNQMLKETIELLNPLPHVKIHIKNTMPIFDTKRILLQQIFINLLSNAIKYNDKPESIIEIDVHETSHYYQFSVKDNGQGIDEAYHKKVFDIFQTLNARDKVEATGVGLSIVKKSVEDMGGEIWLASRLNSGATFTFTWPKKV